MKITKKEPKSIKQPTPLYKPIKLQKPTKISIKNIPHQTKITFDNPTKQISSMNHLQTNLQPHEKGFQLQKQSSNTSIQLKHITHQQSIKQPLIQQITQLKQTIKSYQQQQLNQNNKIITIQSEKQILIKENIQLNNKYEKIKKISQQNTKTLRNHIKSYNQQASEIQILQNKLQIANSQLSKINQNKQLISYETKTYVDSQTITNIQESIQTQYQHLKKQYIQLQKQYNQLLMKINQSSHHKSQCSLETNNESLNDIILRDHFNQIANNIQNKYIKQIQQIEEIFNNTMFQYYQNVKEKQQEIFKLEESLDRLYQERQKYSILGQCKITINMDQMLLKSIQENQKITNKMHQLKQENISLKLNQQQKNYEIVRINNQLDVQKYRRKLFEEQMNNYTIVQKQLLNKKFEMIKSKLIEIEDKNNKLTKQNKEKEEIIKMISIKKKVNIIK